MTIYEVEDVQSFLKINGHWCDYCTGSQLRLGKESHKHFVERKNKKLKTIHTDQSELIEYRFNDFGYRSDNNYNDLLFSTKDYILGIGDSNTEGLGIKNEDIWLEWHEPTTRKHVEFIVRGGYHAPGCKSVLIPQGYCRGKCWRFCE